MMPDEVLQVIVDVWRQREGVDPGVVYRIPITRNTNVERAAKLLGPPHLKDDWVDIADLLESMFRVEINEDRWRTVLEPTKSRTLGPVCDLIAEHALAPAIERTFRGRQLDWPTATFRSVLLILDDAGVNTDGLRPESKLRPLLERHGAVFTRIITRLAPGRMPVQRAINHSLRASVFVLAAALGLWILDQLLHKQVLASLWRLALGVGSLGVLLSISLPVSRYRLGALHTLSDLCSTLTSPPPEVPPPLPHGPDGLIAHGEHWDCGGDI
jgi:hypothetical protein